MFFSNLNSESSLHGFVFEAFCALSITLAKAHLERKISQNLSFSSEASSKHLKALVQPPK